MAAFLHYPLNFDIKDIKELCPESDEPFQRLQTLRQITYLLGY